MACLGSREVQAKLGRRVVKLAVLDSVEEAVPLKPGEDADPPARVVAQPHQPLQHEIRQSVCDEEVQQRNRSSTQLAETHENTNSNFIAREDGFWCC